MIDRTDICMPYDYNEEYPEYPVNHGPHDCGCTDICPIKYDSESDFDILEDE